MITEGIIQVAVSVGAWVAGLFPAAPDLTALLSDTSTGWHSMAASFVGLGVWVDWGFVIGAVGLVGGVYAAMFGAKLVRAIASYLPVIGGAG